MPADIRARSLPGINGLTMQVLEAGFEAAGRPVLLLLHGFPELAFSWRHVLPLLAARGYHAIAPDRRGYGQTTGWRADYEAPLGPFGALNQVQDLVALLAALGVPQVAAVIGHDFGAPLAGWCALTRPDLFRAVVFMSSPFTGAPPPDDGSDARLDAALAALPRPRKHYLRYYTTRAAAADLGHPPQGLTAFLRAYFHMKSGDWPGNAPHPLPAADAAAFAQLPPYYVMALDQDMAQTVLPALPRTPAAWLTDADLSVYATAYARSGFQGGLNEYRCLYDAAEGAGLRALPARTVDVPAAFIGGARDWGVYQTPGALETMRARVCTDFRGVTLVEGAGHWVQQEAPGAVVAALQSFLEGGGSGHRNAPDAGGRPR